ncbi:hypothetical protein [Levilactobacillus fuyuanensis]|uniref:DUF1643 domain-containing protein n=1 Tax=Levilactobacillus fuyuanensis TaxID=2486022 RepID=A0ABW4H474_9LACO|nr:hypothetical protein [Levilactobacillus fuyuanensis]
MDHDFSFNDKPAYVGTSSECRRLGKYSSLARVDMYRHHSVVCVNKEGGKTVLAVGFNPKSVDTSVPSKKGDNSDKENMEPTRARGIYLFTDKLQSMDEQIGHYVQYDLYTEPSDNASGLSKEAKHISEMSLKSLAMALEASDYVLLAWGRDGSTALQGDGKDKVDNDSVHKLQEILKRHEKKIYYLQGKDVNLCYAVTASVKKQLVSIAKAGKSVAQLVSGKMD